MEDLKNLDKLPPEVKNKFVPYVHELLNLYPGQIRSIVIYGSAAGKNYVSKRSDINSTLILDEMGVRHDRRALKLIARGIKQRIAAPLFFTKDYIVSSSDVFPIEFLEIKENHVLVYGEDFFAALDINQENLRLFCEREIKGKFLRIRQAYWEKGLNTRALEVLLKESLHALIPIFRNLIRLKNHRVEIDKNVVIRTLAGTYSLDGRVFEDILRHRATGLRMSNVQARELMEKYLIELEKLMQTVDNP